MEQETEGQETRALKESVSQEYWPRERLLRDGVERLEDFELIAILMRTGIKGLNVLQLSRQLLAAYDNSLIKLSCASLDELKKINGIKTAKICDILAIMELGKRLQRETLSEAKIGCSDDLYQQFVYELGMSDYEEFWIVVVNNGNKVIAKRQVLKGGLSGVHIDLRLLMKEVLLSNGTGFAVAHNHPAGSRKPSREDIALTKRIGEAAKVLDLRFLDHIIVARGNGYYSFADEGLM